MKKMMKLFPKGAELNEDGIVWAKESKQVQRSVDACVKKLKAAGFEESDREGIFHHAEEGLSVTVLVDGHSASITLTQTPTEEPPAPKGLDVSLRVCESVALKDEDGEDIELDGVKLTMPDEQETGTRFEERATIKPDEAPQVVTFPEIVTDDEGSIRVERRVPYWDKKTGGLYVFADKTTYWVRPVVTTYKGDGREVELRSLEVIEERGQTKAATAKPEATAEAAG